MFNKRFLAMLFKELKSGYPIFVFDKVAVKVTQGKVVSDVGIPHIDTHFGNPTEMVVDVNVDVEGKTTSYTMRADSSVGYAKNSVISSDRDPIIREIEMMKSQAEQAVSQVEHQKDVITKCSDILAEFNPAFKEKLDITKRFETLESSVGKLSKMVESLVKELKN